MTKTIAGLAALYAAGAIAGCADTTASMPPARAAAAGNPVAERYLHCNDARQDGNWDAYDRDCLASGFTRHEVDRGDITRDDDLGYWKGVKTAFPDLRLEPQLVLVHGHEVFAVLRATGTHEGVLHCHGDWAGTHKKIGLLAFERVAFDGEGHETEESLYYDSRTVLGQIGVLDRDEGPTRSPVVERWPGAPIIAVSTDDPTEHAHAHVIEQLTEAVNAHKPADVGALFTDDAMDSDPGQEADRHGGSNLGQLFGGLLRVVPDYHREVPELFAAGDYVIAPGLKTGTWGSAPVKLHYVEVAKLDGQRIAELWRFYDVAALEEQMAGVR